MDEFGVSLLVTDICQVSYIQVCCCCLCFLNVILISWSKFLCCNLLITLITGLVYSTWLGWPSMVHFAKLLRPLIVVATCCTLMWQDTKFAVFLFFCLVTDLSATVSPSGVKFCVMVHIGPGQIFSLLGGGALWGSPNLKFAHPMWQVLCFINALVVIHCRHLC